MKKLIIKQNILKKITIAMALFFLFGCSNAEDITVSENEIFESAVVSEKNTKNEAERILSELRNVSDNSGDNADTSEKNAQSESSTSENESYSQGDEYEGARKTIEEISDSDKKVLLQFAAAVWDAYYLQASPCVYDAGVYGWYDIEVDKAYTISRVLVMSMPECFGEETDFGTKIKTEKLANILHDSVGVPQKEMLSFLNNTEEADNGYIELYGGDFGTVSPQVSIKDIYIDQDDCIILNGKLGEAGVIFEMDQEIEVHNMIPFSMKFCYIEDGGIKGFRFCEMELKDVFTGVSAGY